MIKMLSIFQSILSRATVIMELYLLVLVVFAMFNSGYTIGFETNNVVDSLIILVYVAYFLTTLVAIPALIDRWPRAYATSVRLEEVLNLEDKVIKSKNTNDTPNKIEIIKEDIVLEDKDVWAERKYIIKKFTNILKDDRTKVIISMILLMVSTLAMVYVLKLQEKPLI